MKTRLFQGWKDAGGSWWRHFDLLHFSFFPLRPSMVGEVGCVCVCVCVGTLTMPRERRQARGRRPTRRPSWWKRIGRERCVHSAVEAVDSCWLKGLHLRRSTAGTRPTKKADRRRRRRRELDQGKKQNKRRAIKLSVYIDSFYLFRPAFSHWLYNRYLAFFLKEKF